MQVIVIHHKQAEIGEELCTQTNTNLTVVLENIVEVIKYILTLCFLQKKYEKHTWGLQYFDERTG